MKEHYLEPYIKLYKDKRFLCVPMGEPTVGIPLTDGHGALWYACDDQEATIMKLKHHVHAMLSPDELLVQVTVWNGTNL